MTNKMAVSRLFVFAALSAISLFATTATPIQQTITLSTTPAQVGCGTGSRWADDLKISVVPGGTGKVYVGTSAMNTSTLAGVIAVLYPNGGNQSETFYIPNRGVQYDLCDYYVAGDVNGEYALLRSSTVNPTIYPPYAASHPVVTGKFSLSGSSAQKISATNIYFNMARVQVLPGQTGKVFVGRQQFIGHETDNSLTAVLKVLWPNSGSSSVHNAWSESYLIDQPWAYNYNGFWSYDFVVYPAVTTETPLVSIWQTTYSSFGLDGTLQINGGPISLSTTPTHLDSSGLGCGNATCNVMDIRFRNVPGFTGKIYIGNSSMNTSTLAGVFKVLNPNPNGGWTEEWSAGGFTNGVIPSAQCLISPYCPTQTDNIFLPEDFYVAGQYSGDPVLVEYYTDVAGGQVSGHATLFGGVISSTTTAAQLTSNTTGFAHVSVSVVPGGSSKVYIGASSLNRSTLANVYGVLYPNSSGHLGEDFQFSAGGFSLIDLTGTYIATDANESVLWYGYQQDSSAGVGSTTKALAGGVLTPSGSSTGDLVAGSSTIVQAARLQNVPGGSGKIRVGSDSMTAPQPDSTYANTYKVLWPNTGNYSVGEAWSDKFELAPVWTALYYDLHQLKWYPEVSGEQLLLCYLPQ